MSASGLSAIHIMPQGRTVDAEYYVEDILEKEDKPLLSTNKMVLNKRRFTLYQDGAPAHTSKHAQNWCLQNLPNSPDSNPMDPIQHSKQKMYPKPQTLDELKNESERHGGKSLFSNPFCTVCRNA